MATLSECEARERLLAAVSAADALPRGTAFEKVKGARDRLRGELSSVQRTDEDELVKSATACAHRLNQRLSRMRKLGMDATTADAPEPPMKPEPAAPEPAPEAPMKPEPAAPEPAPQPPAPAMSSFLRAIQSLWCTLATERTPGIVGEARGQRALQRGDAASVRGHLPVRGGQGRRRGQGHNCRRQRAAVQLGGQLCGDSVVQGLDGGRVVAGGCRVHRQVRYLSVRGESQGQLPCGDVRAVSHLSVVQDLRDIAGDRSFKRVYLCSRRRLSPVAKASAKELSASYSARGSIPAASTVEYHSVRTPAIRRFRKARPAPRLRSWSEAGSAASVLEPARTRPAPGPHQARTRPAPGFFFRM